MVEPDDDPTALHPEVQRQVAHVRTDLDRFSMLEISSLVRHGYCVGRKACRFNQLGAPELLLSQVGSGVVRTHLVSCDAFGGPGHPLPAEKRRSPAGAGAPGTLEEPRQEGTSDGR